MDKSSILEDAIKYLKLLQERVKILEEKAEKTAMDSVILVKKSQIVLEDEGSSDELSSSFDEQPLPEIEARVSDKHILIRVLCEKQKGVLVNLLCKVESLNMIVVSTNATLFGNVALDITIVAEVIYSRLLSIFIEQFNSNFNNIGLIELPGLSFTLPYCFVFDRWRKNST